uniref:Interferon alpha inducible protein 27 like 2 n=1 Tax=Balaenoptera musculus TaxID=9771 RepID=A0A8C0C766_BALMU
MSAKAIESGGGDATDPIRLESPSDEEDEPSQSSDQASDGSPGKPPQGPPQGPDGSGSDPRDPPKDGGSNFSHKAGMACAAVIGGALAVGAVPVVLGAMGFTGAGIAASSLAAKMMSAAAIANGGGVAAGGLVATLQSVGKCPGGRRGGRCDTPAQDSGQRLSRREGLSPSSSFVGISVPGPLCLPHCPLFWLGVGLGALGACSAAGARSPSALQNLHRALPSLGPASCWGGRGRDPLPFLRGSVLSLVESPPECVSALRAAMGSSPSPKQTSWGFRK